MTAVITATEPDIDPMAQQMTENRSEFDMSVPILMAAEPSHEEIAAEAYARYLNRGCEDGHAVEDWLEAERSLRQWPPAASPRA